SRLSDPLERDRLRRVYMQGLDRVAGHVLPVGRDPEGGWRTGRWCLREERCYLAPGDSPLGLRLPLDSLPWVRAGEYPWVHPPDPMQAMRPLAPRREVRFQPGREVRTQKERAPAAFESAPGITRTAICAEPRNGVLYVFMPPADTLEDYLELVRAVEATAAALGVQVVVEGYEPPRDPRLESLRITPDPGVLEVNIHPAKTWRELVEHTTPLYEQARETRLTTEKFMLAGRHSGTGGGNHFVIG